MSINQQATVTMHDSNATAPKKVNQEPASQRTYTDFKIVGQVLKLCKITTCTVSHCSVVRNSDLECALLNFAITYKNKILTVDEMFFLGESLMQESDEESCKALKDFFSNGDTEFKHQYHMVAQLSG